MVSENFVRLSAKSFKTHGDLPALSDYLNEEGYFTYEELAAVILYPTEFERPPKKSITPYLYTV